MGESEILLEKVFYALNNIPNQKGVGKNGESSYDLAAEIGRHLTTVKILKQ